MSSIPEDYFNRCLTYLNENNINPVGKSDKHDLNYDNPDVNAIINMAHVHHFFVLLNIFRQEHPEIYELHKISDVLNLPKENMEAPYNRILIPISLPLNGKVWKITHTYIYDITLYKFRRGKILFNLDSTLVDLKRHLIFEPTTLIY